MFAAARDQILTIRTEALAKLAEVNPDIEELLLAMQNQVVLFSERVQPFWDAHHQSTLAPLRPDAFRNARDFLQFQREWRDGLARLRAFDQSYLTVLQTEIPGLPVGGLDAATWEEVASILHRFVDDMLNVWVEDSAIGVIKGTVTADSLTAQLNAYRSQLISFNQQLLDWFQGLQKYQRDLTAWRLSDLEPQLIAAELQRIPESYQSPVRSASGSILVAVDQHRLLVQGASDRERLQLFLDAPGSTAAALFGTDVCFGKSSS
ncbi:MAG: hypothetical protein LR015_06125 [Verrucomicrobia bacterium]|nr:hypothetical protein [Verrucomicrobiota bacterium]